LKHGPGAVRATCQQNILQDTSIGFVENIAIKRKQLMGLDQFAYVAGKSGALQNFYNIQYGENGHLEMPGTVDRPRDIAYWRKHANLQGFMERVWRRKNNFVTTPNQQCTEDQTGQDFNGIELELTWQDLQELEQAVTQNKLPPTTGFFFGQGADETYHNRDLKFVRDAKAELFMGLKVFYNSSW